MAGSNRAQLLPHVSLPPDQVEKQRWSAIPAWGGQLEGGEGHEFHTTGAQRLHDDCYSVTNTALCSPFLVQAKGEFWGWKDALPLAEDYFSSERDSMWWDDPTTCQLCGGVAFIAGDSRGCGAESRAWR